MIMIDALFPWKLYDIWTTITCVSLTECEKYDTMHAWIDKWGFGFCTGAGKSRKKRFCIHRLAAHELLSGDTSSIGMVDFYLLLFVGDNYMNLAWLGD